MSVPFCDLGAVNARYREQLKAAAMRVIDSGWYVLGEEVEAFEDEFAAYCGVRHAVGVGNGLDALSLILRAYQGRGELKPGDEVLVPANTFIATFLAVSQSGLVPVPVEPDDASFNIDAMRAADAIGPRTRAIIAVHLYGQVANMSALAALAAERGLLLIEDAAQAHGARQAGRMAGALGHAAAFSFFPSKNLGALGDGGAVTTDDQDLARRVAILRNYGSATKYHHDVQGTNSRLDEMQAALLRVKLGWLDDEIERRRDVARIYRQGIDHPDIRLPKVESETGHVWHLFVLRSSRRDELQRHLREQGIQTQVHYPVPVHRQPAYASLHGTMLPVAERMHDEVLSLPMSAAMGIDAAARVVAACRAFPEAS